MNKFYFEISSNSSDKSYSLLPIYNSIIRIVWDTYTSISVLVCFLILFTVKQGYLN